MREEWLLRQRLPAEAAAAGDLAGFSEMQIPGRGEVPVCATALLQPVFHTCRSRAGVRCLCVLQPCYSPVLRRADPGQGQGCLLQLIQSVAVYVSMASLFF